MCQFICTFLKSRRRRVETFDEREEEKNNLFGGGGCKEGGHLARACNGYCGDPLKDSSTHTEEEEEDTHLSFRFIPQRREECYTLLLGNFEVSTAPIVAQSPPVQDDRQDPMVEGIPAKEEDRRKGLHFNPHL